VTGRLYKSFSVAKWVQWNLFRLWLSMADMTSRGIRIVLEERSMVRAYVFMELGDKGAEALKAFIKEARSHRERTRAQAVWFSAQGRSVQEITHLLSVTERAVRKWFAA